MSYDDDSDEKPMVPDHSPRAVRKSSRRRWCLVSILSVALVLAVCVAVAAKFAKPKDSLTSSESVSAACTATSYPAECQESLASSNGTPVSMSKASLTTADAELVKLDASTVNEDCRELLVTAREQVQLALDTTFDTANATMREEVCGELQTGLSAALEGLETCLRIFNDIESYEAYTFPDLAAKATKVLSNSLSLLNCLCVYGADVAAWNYTVVNFPENWDLLGHGGGGRRRLLNSEPMIDDFPTWVPRRHLLARPSSYNVIVAKDGSGKYKTLSEAIKAAPQTGKKKGPRYTIYVKAGVYNENIEVPRKLTNLMIIGDGIDRTIFTGNRNVALMKRLKMTTFRSATMIISGPGFIGKYFTVRNTAGAEGHQAVATRVSADRVAHYMVKFDGYQDTLYCHSFRQFYRNCIISGTVDFVFGNGAAAFQNCQLVAKKSTLVGQQNTYTAQGRTDPHQNTGLAFQDCSFDATPELKKSSATFPSFLGRPWKKYSVCVLLRPTIQAHVDPAGWLRWNTSSFGLWTSFFAEYQGKGPGSNTRKRVPWSYQIKDVKTARKYQAGTFIKGKNWLPDAADVPYSLQPL